MEGVPSFLGWAIIKHRPITYEKAIPFRTTYLYFINEHRSLITK